jgi:type IV pilus assembly protein PilQ
MARVEAKLAEQRALARAPRTPAGSGTVSGLESQLAAKRIEIDAAFKQAQLAHKDRAYDLALELTQRVLVQDPLHTGAQRLLRTIELAKLSEEEWRLTQIVERDERAMMNEVIDAQRVPTMREIMLKAPALTSAGAGQGLIAQRLTQPITFDFADVPLGDVVEFIADAAGVSVVPSPQLDLKARKVSLKVTELPLGQALKYLAKQQDLGYRFESDAIVLATAEEFSNEPLATRVFFMRNGLSPFALQMAAIKSNPALAMENVKELILRSVPQPTGSKVVVDERTGAIVVTNTAEHLQMAEALLGQLDVAPLQVLIEARFVELTLTDLEHLGLEAILNGDAALDKKGASNGTRGAGQQLASGGGSKFAALARESEGLNLTLQGVLTGTQFEAVLHLLDETSKSKTLSAPRVTALNNQSARIRVVEEFNYPTRYEVSLIQFDINGDGDFDDAGETEFANVPQDLQSRDVGILLNVTPSVGKDRKTITLVLAPEVSEFSQFRDLGGGVIVPEFTSSQLTTSIVIQNGHTVVLGGLMQDSVSTEMDKVPFFGDLPLVGNLFRQSSKSSTRTNLLIFVTARLLAPTGPTT